MRFGDPAHLAGTNYNNCDFMIIKVILSRFTHVLRHTSCGKSLGKGSKCTPPKVAASVRGLKIPIELTIEMEHTEKSQLCIKKYEALI